MTWSPDAPQCYESDKVKYLVVPYTRGAVLDVGCGPKKAFPHFIGIDNKKDVELFGIPMQPDLVVEDATNLQPYVQDGSCDAIFSSHLLEHLVDTPKALRSWWQTIKVGGHLVLYLPHCDLYPRIGTEHANIDHVHDFHPDDIVALMRGVGGWDLLVNETRDGGNEYSFLQVYRKREDWKQSMVYKHPPKGPTCCVVRYGGFGDQLQAANVLPELKRQGYRVTFMTTPKGQDILKHDPHIDDWIIQDTDQVPNPELWEYWAAWQPKFDKWVNLSASVEQALLATPGTERHTWPQSVRHKYLNVNYLEFTAELAEIPYKSESRFYPSPEEVATAKAARGPEFTILWALSGSSVHKYYPWQDVALQRILDMLPDCRVILVGDDACKILEVGWEEHPRVRCLSGELGIRATLALAQQCDMVIGPETGVLNAVAFEPMPKVILLSHSSVENLTKHWVNTTSLVATDTPCYPCHRLHPSMRYCPQHAESGAAMCQVDIPPDALVAAVNWHHAVATAKRVAA